MQPFIIMTIIKTLASQGQVRVEPLPVENDPWYKQDCLIDKDTASWLWQH